MKPENVCETCEELCICTITYTDEEGKCYHFCGLLCFDKFVDERGMT